MIGLISKGVLFMARGGWLMLPIVIFSIFSLTIIIERFFFFMDFRKFKTPKIVSDILVYIDKGRIKDALLVCEKNSYYITNILKAGIYRYNYSKEIIREAMEKASLYEIPKLEKNLGFLSTLAHVSPLLGLLGTIVGLVKSFYSIEQKAHSAGMVNPSDIAGGIWEALLTTVAGLGVAIISYLAYNYFSHKVNKCILESEQAATELHELALEKHQL